jgi:hypothetical protein
LVGNEYLADYQFKSDASLSAGRYVHIADSDSFVILQDCTSHQLVAVAAASIAHVEEVPYQSFPEGPSLWDVYVNNRKPLIGFRSAC